MADRTPLRKLAYKESLARVSETCPDVRGAGTRATSAFCLWLERQGWFKGLSKTQRIKLECRAGELAQDVADGARERGTLILREALVTVIEERMAVTMSPERIKAINAGTDQGALLAHG